MEKEINFLSLPTNKVGALAQLVEHRTENPGVPGSIPGGTTNLKKKPVASDSLRVFYFQKKSISNSLK